MIRANPTSYIIVPNTSTPYMQMIQPPDLSKEEKPMEKLAIEKPNGSSKRDKGLKHHNPLRLRNQKEGLMCQRMRILLLVNKHGP